MEEYLEFRDYSEQPGSELSATAASTATASTVSSTSEISTEMKYPARKRLKLDLSPLRSDVLEVEVDEDSKNISGSTSGSADCDEGGHCSQLSPTSQASQQNELVELRVRIKEKEEKLRQLKLLRFYQKQNSLEDLKTLVDKWRQVVQSAASDLYEHQKSSCYEDLTMEEFLRKLNVDPGLIDLE